MNPDPMTAALTLTLQEVCSQWLQTRAGMIAAEQQVAARDAVIAARDAEIAQLKAPPPDAQP